MVEILILVMIQSSVSGTKLEPTPGPLSILSTLLLKHPGEEPLWTVATSSLQSVDKINIYLLSKNELFSGYVEDGLGFNSDVFEYDAGNNEWKSVGSFDKDSYFVSFAAETAVSSVKLDKISKYCTF